MALGKLGTVVTTRKKSQVQALDEQVTHATSRRTTVPEFERMLRQQDLPLPPQLTNGRSNNGSGGVGDHDHDPEDRILHRQYDPANFIVPGSDAQGHSERIQCRVPPGMLRQISAIVASKRFPFKTDGDVYRWAVWVGIQLLDRLEPTPNTFIARVEAANSIIREQIYLQEYAATIGELDKMVQSYLSSGARGEAQKLIARVRAQYERIDEVYWRDRLLGEIKSRFGHLMGGVKSAELNNKDDNDKEESEHGNE